MQNDCRCFVWHEKAVTTHIDISHSARQNQSSIFFPWMKLWAKINTWCLIWWKTLCKYSFCSFWESAMCHDTSLDLWSQLKSVPGVPDGEGLLVSWTFYWSSAVPGYHSYLCKLLVAPNQLWNRGFAVNPGNFYSWCLICVVFRNEIRFGGMPALPILEETPFWSVIYAKAYLCQPVNCSASAEQQKVLSAWDDLY